MTPQQELEDLKLENRQLKVKLHNTERSNFRLEQRFQAVYDLIITSNIVIESGDR